MSAKLKRILTVFVVGGLIEVALAYGAKYTHSHCLLNLYAVLYVAVGLLFSSSFAALIGYVLDGEDFTL